MIDQTEPIKITSAHRRRQAEPGTLASQITALTRARMWWDDTETAVPSDCQALTITALRTLREVVAHEVQNMDSRVYENRGQAQVTLCSLEERCTNCILRIQAFQEERPTRDVYTRLAQQRFIYTVLSEVIQKAWTLSPESHRKEQHL